MGQSPTKRPEYRPTLDRSIRIGGGKWGHATDSPELWGAGLYRRMKVQKKTPQLLTVRKRSNALRFDLSKRSELILFEDHHNYRHFFF